MAQVRIAGIQFFAERNKIADVRTYTGMIICSNLIR